ncbi:MAG: RNA-directed DNA polymerase, partial [Gammaproteobacteria bacterium]|nr:RNA-directed DNA polymerase [Gammaproteobacteria bacterium]
MGLKTAGSFFQRLMNKVFNGILDDGIFCYLDDICIATSSFENHLEKLTAMLDQLRAALLKLKPRKCVLLLENTKYLGHIVSRQGLTPDPKKVEGIKTYPEPNTQTEVRRFLGMASYYRKFVPNFSRIAQPMRELTEKDQKFIWDEACQISFDTLKRKLMEPPVLHYPDAKLGEYFI